jgi:hypothetical protein
MKINVISNDGTRVKDFIDIYYLLNEYSVEHLLENYNAKYKLRNALHALKSLNYFEEVDTNDWPELIVEKDLNWLKVKKKIDEACRAYTRSIRIGK